ncbi:hypothetical protein ACHQM5_027971 [Ranunculus cassubicifolius]
MVIFPNHRQSSSSPIIANHGIANHRQSRNRQSQIQQIDYGNITDSTSIYKSNQINFDLQIKSNRLSQIQSR